jgi:hypothetical protein
MFDALTYQLRRGHYERWPPAVGLEHVHESCAARDDISYGISLSSQLSSDLSIYSIVQGLEICTFGGAFQLIALNSLRF